AGQGLQRRVAPADAPGSVTADPGPVPRVAGGAAPGGAAQEPDGGGDRVRAEQLGGADPLCRGGIPGHRQQHGRARDEAGPYWAEELVERGVAARWTDGGGTLQLHIA